MARPAHAARCAAHNKAQVLRIRIYRASEFDELQGMWSELMSNDPLATPFQSFAWGNCWSIELSRGRAEAFVSDDHSLFLLERKGNVLRSGGIGPSDYLQPISPSGDFSSISQALLESKASLIDLHQVRASHPLTAEFANAEISRQALCYVLDLPATYDQFVETLSKSMRYEARRVQKGPYRSKEAVVRFHLTPEERIEAWKIFLHLHAKRWRKRGLPGAFAFARIQRFHEHFLTVANPELASLLTVWHHDVPVGAIYLLHGAKTTYFYQSGFDPEAKALSPGTVLVSEAIRKAIEYGHTQFDFLRGAEPYKLRWGPQHAIPNQRIMSALTFSGQHRVRWSQNVAQRIETAIRARLERHGMETEKKSA